MPNDGGNECLLSSCTMDIPRSGRDLHGNGACVNDRWRTVVQWSWRSHSNYCETGKTERSLFLQIVPLRTGQVVSKRERLDYLYDSCRSNGG
jgi:hypothetical protein